MTSTRVVEILAGLPFLLISVVLPVLSVAARDDLERLRYMTGRTTEVMAIGGVLLALTLAIAAKPIVLVLGGPEYEPAVPVLQIQCLAAVTIFLVAAWIPTLIGLGRARDLAIAVGTGLLTLLVAGLILIPLHQAKGAAFAAVAGDLAYALAAFVALWRAGPGRELPFRQLGLTALAAVPAAAVAAVPGVPDIVLAVLAAAVYIGLVLALRLVPPEMTHAIRSRLGGVLARRRA